MADYIVRFKTSRTGYMQLNYPTAIEKCALCRLRPIFGLMVRNGYGTDYTALQQTQDEIERCLSNAKLVWHGASQRYQQEYRCVPNGYHAQEVQRNNNRLLQTLKRAKHAYDRMLKVKAIFEDVTSGVIAPVRNDDLNEK